MVADRPPRQPGHTDARDRYEGALLVSGLLDAVVTADGHARAGDTVLTGEQPVDGPSLADVLIVEPDSPIDPTLVHALLRSIARDTAAPPDGYVSHYIGTTAREKARAEQIAELEAQLAALDAQRGAAEVELDTHRNALIAATAEQQSLPTSTMWQQTRVQAQTAQRAAWTADREAAERQARADAILQTIRAELAAASQARDRALAALSSQLDTAIALAEQAGQAAMVAREKATEDAELAEQAAALLEDAVAGQALADAQRQEFPSLTALFAALDEEDEATRELTAAQAKVVDAAERVRSAQIRTKQSLMALNRAVDLGDGRMLPAEPVALNTFAAAGVRAGREAGGGQDLGNST